jgi:hypothetical protein
MRHAAQLSDRAAHQCAINDALGFCASDQELARFCRAPGWNQVPRWRPHAAVPGQSKITPDRRIAAPPAARGARPEDDPGNRKTNGSNYVFKVSQRIASPQMRRFK